MSGWKSVFLIALACWDNTHVAAETTEESCPANASGLCGQQDSPFIRLGAAPLRQPPRIRGRDSIPHSHLPFMPQFMAPAREDFPAVFRYQSVGSDVAGDALKQFITRELHKFGAIVVKGLPVTSAEEFSALMHATGLELRDYVGGVTSRPLAAPKVTPASGEDPSVSMESHNDNPYWVKPPLRLVLFCQQPAKSGGQGFLTDGRAVLRQLREEHPELVEALQRRKVRYLHFYPDADAFVGSSLVSWQDAYAAGCSSSQGCDLKAAAAAALEREGHSFEWVSTGLRRWEVSDGIKIHPVTGEETWTNQITAMHCSVFDNHPVFPELRRAEDARSEACRMRGAMPFHTAFGDGEEFPPELQDAVRKAQWNHSVTFDYEAGDVVLIDNYAAMHGRISFELPRQLFITLVG